MAGTPCKDRRLRIGTVNGEDKIEMELCTFIFPCLHHIHDRDYDIHSVDKASDSHKDRSSGGENAFLAHADGAADGADAGEQDGQ